MESLGNMRPTTPSKSSPGISRSGSLSDRMKSSFKGGISGLLKKSQDNARLKARLSKATLSRPSSAAGAEVINDRTEDGKPVELPTKEPLARKQTAETTNSSVVDPNYSPNSKAFRNTTGKQEQHLEVQGETSFFEDSSDEEEDSPVIQRASSVRVGKPVLVRHVSNAANVVGQSTPLRKRDDRSKTPELSAEKSEPLREEKDGPADALRCLEGNDRSRPLPSPPNTAMAYKSTLGGDITASPASSVFSNIQGNQSIPSTPPVTITTPLSPLSALRSNPITPTTELASPRLFRAVSAPIPPHRNPNRRVTIRPSDLVIDQNDNDHRLFRASIITTPYPGSASDTRTTNRLSDIPDTGEASRANSFSTDGQPHVQLLSPHTLPTSLHGPGDRDRFPSFTGTESLIITLSLFNHPTSASTLEISIPSSTAPPLSPSVRGKSRSRLSRQPPPQPEFDDNELFNLLRNHYHNSVIGIPRRWFFLPACNLYHATYIPTNPDVNSNDVPHLDTVDFVAHIRNPGLGKGKTNWLFWLRNNQQAPRIAAAAAAPRGNRTSSLFSYAPTTHASQSAHSNGSIGVATIANNVPYALVQTPSRNDGTPLGLGSGVQHPRMPFAQSPAFLARKQQVSSSSGLAPVAATTATTASVAMAPHIALHHRTNLLTVSAAGVSVLVVGVLTMVFWVLFGVPGLGAGDSIRKAAGLGGNEATREAASYGDWKVDAQMRVLTGLVMGAVVWVGGLVGVVGWTLGGWLLL